MKRLAWIAAALLVVLVAAAPYLPADVFRWSIQRALERGLGRQVEVGDVHFTFFPGPFPGPGFTVDNVVIHEDARAGIEPFAHVETLGARVRILSLFRRKLEFSSLNLEDATINLVKTDAGSWNFQFLLDTPAVTSGTMPALRMRAGRVNFKFGDTKSVFYFNDADLNVAPASDGSLELRFGGAPSRTDRSAQDFGRFYVRGTSAPGNQRLDFDIELEKSALEETLRLIDPNGFGVHGTVALNAHVSGPPSRLDVSGQLQVADIHRWDLLPTNGSGWQLGFGGSLDLRGERLDVQSTTQIPNTPVVVRFRAWDFLKTPHWDAGADLAQVPLEALLKIGEHMGVAVPEKLAIEGSVTGSVTYNERDGVAGRMALRDASLTLPEAEPLQAAVAVVEIGHGAVSLEPVSVRIGEKQSADLEGSYVVDAARTLDLKITTRGLSVAAMRSFGLGAIPLLELTPQGTWRGWARYRSGEWTGESELLNARIAIDGLAEPVNVRSASVSLGEKRVSLKKVQATVGMIDFSGDYRWDPKAVRPHKFTLAIPVADARELQRLFAPALLRQRGFLARTLRLGADSTVPQWLQERRADGTVSIESLTAGDMKAHQITARLLWDATLIRLAGLGGLLGAVDPAIFAGDLEIDLTHDLPHFHFDGTLADIGFKGGSLDLEGTLDAEGAGVQLIESARAEGTLRGRSIAFNAEAGFRTAAACFELQGSRWKLSNIEVDQDGETLAGSGASQSDGHLLLDLASHARQFHYSASLFAMTSPTAP